MANNESMTIQITNLTVPQRLAIEDMLAQWVRLGGQGSSRWTAFFADGDGNFHPRIAVSTAGYFAAPQVCERGGGTEKRWTTMHLEGSRYPDPVYLIDYDDIAWDINRNGDKKEAHVG